MIIIIYSTTASLQNTIDLKVHCSVDVQYSMIVPMRGLDILIPWVTAQVLTVVVRGRWPTPRNKQDSQAAWSKTLNKTTPPCQILNSSLPESNTNMHKHTRDSLKLQRRDLKEMRNQARKFRRWLNTPNG